MSASGNSCCSTRTPGCCQDCSGYQQEYEHLPVPRLQHQQPPPPLYQNQQQKQEHQQGSCLTTLQQTTTASSNCSYGNCLMPTTATTSTYVSNIGTEQPLLTMQHCHSHCNMQHCNSTCGSNKAPAIYNNIPAQSMIFVPVMLPMQQQHPQQQQHHLHTQPPLPPPEDCKPLLLAKSVPPPPQPPPMLTHFQAMMQPPPLPPSPMMPPQRFPSRTPTTPPLPGTYRVQSLKSAAAAAVSDYQRFGQNTCKVSDIYPRGWL
ncbi:GD21363 [Drosophila simulans]|uniref:GD21363 n=1 Tax=Drosophila simulans TaxID=7240 RepID=B4QY68_DROSI|nr:GD21363 [Drosophila simulans]